jgi:hypothetical protein
MVRNDLFTVFSSQGDLTENICEKIKKTNEKDVYFNNQNYIKRERKSSLFLQNISIETSSCAVAGRNAAVGTTDPG